ncbi:MAG TPA: hypothetical protein VFB02_04130 [Bradyrhizobium sp.]|nr:hypothetical protein [Bradyrhizobium sp.]
MRKLLTTVIVLAAVAVLVIVCVLVLTILNKGAVGPEMTLPLLIISGVMMLLVTLALTAFVFSSVDLVDKSQALGLPEGSVRSVIALSLVLLFAILAVYLYSSMATSGKIVPAQVAGEDMRIQLKQNLLPGQFVYEQPSADGKGFTIFYRQTASPASEDFAKQLLAMIGTLVTAVASFYFGSKTAISAQAAGSGVNVPAGAPVIRAVNPSKVVRGTLTKLEITGDGLDLIKEVKAVSKDRQVLATEVLSNASHLKCSLAMDLDAPTGAWDIIVSDGSGKEAKLAGSLIVE